MTFDENEMRDQLEALLGRKLENQEFEVLTKSIDSAVNADDNDGAMRVASFPSVDVLVDKHSNKLDRVFLEQSMEARETLTRIHDKLQEAWVKLTTDAYNVVESTASMLTLAFNPSVGVYNNDKAFLNKKLEKAFDYFDEQYKAKLVSDAINYILDFASAQNTIMSALLTKAFITTIVANETLKLSAATKEKDRHLPAIADEERITRIVDAILSKVREDAIQFAVEAEAAEAHVQAIKDANAAMSRAAHNGGK